MVVLWGVVYRYSCSDRPQSHTYVIAPPGHSPSPVPVEWHLSWVAYDCGAAHRTKTTHHGHVIRHGHWQALMYTICNGFPLGSFHTYVYTKRHCSWTTWHHSAFHALFPNNSSITLLGHVWYIICKFTALTSSCTPAFTHAALGTTLHSAHPSATLPYTTWIPTLVQCTRHTKQLRCWNIKQPPEVNRQPSNRLSSCYRTMKNKNTLPLHVD